LVLPSNCSRDQEVRRPKKVLENDQVFCNRRKFIKLDFIVAAVQEYAS
jgi:hypothetical protein